MDILKTLNLVLAFILELAMLAALSYGGYHLIPNQPWLQWVLALALPTIVIVLWGLFLAPRSDIRLKQPALALMKLALFTTAAVLLHLSGQTSMATTFLTLAFINTGLSVIWKQ